MTSLTRSSVVTAWLPGLLFGTVPACAGRNHADPPELATRGTEESSARKKAEAPPAANAAGNPNRVPSTAIVPLPGRPTAFLAALEKAQAASRDLARASGHEAAVAAGDVLSMLAHALTALPDPDHLASKDVTEVQFQAKRLRRSDRFAYSLPKWIQEGLGAALAGLEKLIPTSDSSRFWIGAARQAQKSVDANAGLPFQRAPVQDAVRTTIDAFIVVGQGLCVCP
jgi:hypothetical protein